MSATIRDWALGVAVALLAAQQIKGTIAPEARAGELLCTKLTVVDGDGRPRIILDGSPAATAALLRVLDSAGTPRAALAVEQEPGDEIIDSNVKFSLFDHTGALSLELIQEGNHQHGSSSRLDLYGTDLDGKAEWTTMLGTQPLQGWPVLSFSPDRAGMLSLGLADYGIPFLMMRNSPHKPGTWPVLVEERSADRIGSFTLHPGERHGQVLVGEQDELVTRPVGK